MALRGAVLLCLLLLPVAGAAQTRASRPVGRAPLTFEENRGQTDARVRFLARGKGYTLFLTPDEALVSLTGRERHQALRMRLVGARVPSSIAAADQLRAKTHYFQGSEPRRWTADVPTYARVRYTGVYRGIDLVYYGSQQELEYDFVVAAGADPRVIRMRFAGAADLRVTPEGDLLMNVGGRDIRQRRPVAFQTREGRHDVPVEYALKHNGEVSFRLGDYDPTLPLTIDPVLLNSTYWGEEFGIIYGVATDSTGAAYVAGTAVSIGFPTTSGAWQETNGGDGFVTKFDASGAVVYSTYLGGHGTNYVYAIAVDRFGAAYVTGLTDVTDFPTTPGAFQPSCTQYPPGVPLAGRCYAGFVAKLNPSGSALAFSTYLGGAGVLITGAGTYPAGIAVDDALDVYLTGSTSPGFPVTPGVFQPTFAGGATYMPFVAKMNSTGTGLIYASYLGGARGDTSKHIAIDAAGNAYVTGQAVSPDFPTTPGALRRTCRERDVIGGGCSIAFVAKIDSTATSLVYSTFLGGVGDAFKATNGMSSEGTGIAADPEGHAYVTGIAYTADFPTTPGSLKPATTSKDTFVSKLNLDGTDLIYSTYLGGDDTSGQYTGQELNSRIAVDSEGRAYIAGRTSSSDFPLVDPVQSSPGGAGFDAFVSQLSADGSALLFSTRLGGAGDEESTALALDASGSIWVAGLTNSADFPTVNAVRSELPGSRSGFVAKIGEPVCGTEVTGQVQVFQSAIVPFFPPFNLQLVIVWNNSASAVNAPLAYVMDDLQNAVFVGTSKTRCFSPAGDPLTLVPVGDDNVLAPNEARLLGLWFYRTQLGPIAYTPRLLSGTRNY